MGRIDSRSKTVRGLLNGVKYALDYYQREYKWGSRHAAELLEDLEAKFLSSYVDSHERAQVQDYVHYFLGSIVISQKKGQSFIIDGQQRLTTLTLLLIYLHHLQRGRDDKVDVHNLIFSEKFGKKSFNLDVPERAAVMETLYAGQQLDFGNASESTRNIVARYADIEELFPDALKERALPFFIDWLLENVDIVEITAYTDDDAYTIFETMNDRGLSLSPTDMLKGYLLAHINDPAGKAAANDLWRHRILELVEIEKDAGSDFFKAWLRAKYATSIRERERGASNKDFEQIGTGFHKWVRDNRKQIGLNKSTDFREFVEDRFARFTSHYVTLRAASQRLTPGLEYVLYNGHNNFTLQYPLILAALRLEDDQDTVNRKIRLVAGYIDIFVARRIMNFRTLGYSSIVYTMFNLMKDTRDLDVYELAVVLQDRVESQPETFEGVNRFYVHQQNRRHVHHLLARMTHHIEQESGVESSFETYVSREMKKPFEIEHIWADDYERHTDGFDSPEAFAEYRNHFGGLVLLPRGFNQSLGADTYERKVKAYFGQNLLAKSLNEQCYQNNPSFLAYVEQSALPFRPHAQFTQADLDARQDLYRRICEEIWSPTRFQRELA